MSGVPLVEMAGDTLAGCLVLRRLPRNGHVKPQWLVRASCGHEFAISGPALRQAHKLGVIWSCQECACAKIREAAR